ncbi:ABC transporter ATP-binding protein [Saxibacter everestensis]|uniref:ABC transporter ATP-binding protein n=1 Tax=Saxibacter everestensis TaxID=2909229 RepID=A0ABY8QR29_9MICO|nr:ABC transporter ATP-binding protein [Brevibacteriaceae bacterium ZFBP1038]
MTENVLEVSGLRVEFSTESGTITGVDGVDLEIAPGEVLALVGESGSGKSTVALSIMGLLSRNASASGEVRVSGERINPDDPISMSAKRGSLMGMVFQEPSTALNPLHRIGDQIAEVVRNHGTAGRSAAQQRAVELLRLVGIPQPEIKARAYPHQLSGGQRQRVVIAIAIANSPKLLVADEPTTALDVTVQAEILDLLRDLAERTGTSVLLVTHNMGVVADFADRVAVMLNGEIVESGTVDDVLLRPEHDYTVKLLAAVPRLRWDVVEESPARKTDDVEPADATVIELENVSVVYGRGRKAFRALDGVSFGVKKGTTLGLVGESGSGKSTAGRTAIGLIKPSSGAVRLFGQDFASLRRPERRRLQSKIGIVLQDPVASLDPRMGVLDCVAEPLLVHGRPVADSSRSAGRYSRNDARRAVADMLDAVHLPAGVISRYPHELSGGQRQRISLARALILDPQLLIADEATSALDVSVQASVLGILSELQQRLGFACLFISHDLAVVQEMAQNVVVLRNGRVVEAGPTAATLVRPQDDYTSALLAAVPVPDPVAQRERRLARLRDKTQFDQAQGDRVS